MNQYYEEPHEESHERIYEKPPAGRYYRKSPNRFFLTVLSALPGLNYMYLGLIKRGAFVMSSFFVLCYLSIEFELFILAFALPVIFFATYFDSLKKANQMRAGMVIDDTVADITNLVYEYRVPGIIVLGISIVYSIAKGLLYTFASYTGYEYYYFRSGFTKPAVLILLAVVLYFVFKSCGKSKIPYQQVEDDHR